MSTRAVGGYTTYEIKTSSTPVYDPERDMYVDPVTGVEDPGCRQRRLIEESSRAMYDY